jgi:quercetin dioxygenase-like cupin family protein
MRIFSIATILAGGLLILPAFGQDHPNVAAGSKADVILKTTKTMIDAPIVFPATGKPEITMMILTMDPNGHTSMHKHPSPTFGYVMDGIVEIKTDNGVQTFKAGQAFVEPLDSPMQIRNTNPGISKLVICVAGTEGTPVAVPIK